MSGWMVRAAKNGRPALVRPDGTWSESRFKPDVDALRRIEVAGIAPGDDILLIGCGAGELPRLILERNGEGRLIIVEPCGRALDAAIEFDPQAEWINSERLTVIAFGVSTTSHRNGNVVLHSDPHEFIRSIARCRDCDKYLVHPNVEIPAELEPLKQYLNDLEVRRASGHRFGDESRANIEENRGRFLGGIPVRSLKDLLSGSDIVVAGGGPSLGESAAAIGANANWIAVGTAVRPLVCARITPDLVVMTDPQAEVARQLPSGLLYNLVAFPSTATAAVNNAPRLISAFPEGDGGDEIQPLRDEIGELPAGGTVTTTAIGLAVLLGAKRVFLAGVDLAEQAGVSHADGSVPHQKGVAETGRFDGLEDRYTARAVHATEPAVDVQGRPIMTRKNLAIYARAIERLAARFAACSFFQCSETAHAMAGVTYIDPRKLTLTRRSFSLPENGRSLQYTQLYGKY